MLIEIEPGRLEVPDAAQSVADLRATIERSVADGLRATLKTGNLLTGAQLISFDFFPGAPPKELSTFGEWTMLPTEVTGFGRIEEQAGALLAKLNALPLDSTIGNANKALASADQALASLDAILEAPGTQALPDELASALNELRSVLDGFSQDAELYENLSAAMARLSRTLDNLDSLSRSLAEKPNSVLFPPKPTPDPIPEAQ